MNNRRKWILKKKNNNMNNRRKCLLFSFILFVIFYLVFHFVIIFFDPSENQILKDFTSKPAAYSNVEEHLSQRGVTGGCASSTGWVPPACEACSELFIYDAKNNTCNECQPNKWGLYCNNTCPGMTEDNKPCFGNGVCLDGVRGVGKCLCTGFGLRPEFYCKYDFWVIVSRQFLFFYITYLLLCCIPPKLLFWGLHHYNSAILTRENPSASSSPKPMKWGMLLLKLPQYYMSWHLLPVW